MLILVLHGNIAMFMYFHVNVGTFITGGLMSTEGGTPTEDLSYRCTSPYMRGKRSTQSSVVNFRAQLRVYSK